jgi:hypothetical protein
VGHSATAAAGNRRVVAHVPGDDYRTELLSRLHREHRGAAAEPAAPRAGFGRWARRQRRCTRSARYVCFNTFFEARSGFMLLPESANTRPPAKFPPELRRALAARGQGVCWSGRTCPGCRTRSGGASSRARRGHRRACDRCGLDYVICASRLISHVPPLACVGSHLGYIIIFVVA